VEFAGVVGEVTRKAKQERKGERENKTLSAPCVYFFAYSI